MSITFKEAVGLAGVEESLAQKASEPWPQDVGRVAKALAEIGVPKGKELVELAKTVWELHQETRRREGTKPTSRMSPEELIRAIAANPQDRELVTAFREKVGGDPGQIFAVNDNGTINPEASIQAYRHRDELPKQPITGKVKGFFWRTLNALRGERAWADPFNEGKRLSYFSDWYEVAEEDHESFMAVWWTYLFNQSAFKQLGSAGLYAQYRAIPQGEHIRQAKEALRSPQGEEQRKRVEQHLIWSEDARKGGDCDEKPFRSQR